MLVDQEDNPDQSRSFEGDKDVLIGKEWQEVFQCNIYFKAALGLLISCNTNTYRIVINYMCFVLQLMRSHKADLKYILH